MSETLKMQADAALIDDRAEMRPADIVSVSRRTAMLCLLALIYSLNYLDRQVVVILQEPIKADFQLLDWQLGMLTGGAFGLFYTMLGIPIAQQVDRGVHRVRLIALLTAIWSVMTAICGMTRGFGQFLVARMAVGLAEAGFTPCAHSLISDLYPPRQRPQAIGLFAIGLPVGVMIGLSMGGIIAQAAGWRTALLVTGAPGLLLALAFPLISREPSRGATEPGGGACSGRDASEGFFEAAWLLVRRPAFRHVLLATAATAFAQTGLSSWLPSFLIRVHHLSLSEAGLGLGMLTGLCGMAGTVLGGWQATRLGANGEHKMLWLPAGGLALAIPIYVVALLAGSGPAVLLLLIPPFFLSALWTAPATALMQNLAPVAMRARASALQVVVANLIGVSLGPVAAGALSDWFGAMRGDPAAGLRDALVVMVLLLGWGIVHWLLASRALARGGETAPA